MRKQILVIGAVAALGALPLGWARAGADAHSEATWLTNRLVEQRARIQQLEARIRALAGPGAPAPAPTPARAGAIHAGLSAQELRQARGEPDFVSRAGGAVEVWGYGPARVTLMNGRVTSWQNSSIELPAAPAPRAPHRGMILATPATRVPVAEPDDEDVYP